MRKNKNNSFDLLKDETIYLTILTTIVYILCYIIERNEQAYYHIPSAYTEMSLLWLIENGWKVFTTVLIPILIILFITKMIAKLGETPLEKFFTDRLIKYIFLIIIVNHFEKIRPTGILHEVISYILCFIFIEILIIPLLSIDNRKKRERVKNRLKYIVNRKGQLKKFCYYLALYEFYLRRGQFEFKKNYLEILPRSFWKFIKLGLTVLLVGYISAGTGILHAKNRVVYPITQMKNKENLVILSDYKDYYITAPIDLKKREITAKFKFINKVPSNNEHIIIYYKKIGPLKVNIPKFPK